MPNWCTPKPRIQRSICSGLAVRTRGHQWASYFRPIPPDCPAHACSDRYGANLLAMAVAKSHAGRLAYISEFVEEAKASGVVQQAIERGGLRGLHVAPPTNPGAQK